MAYTTLRITESGVVLLDAHTARFTLAGREAERAFLDFARTAKQGIWSVHWKEGRLVTSRREASLLFDGIPVRYEVSPFVDAVGPHPKPASPSPYDAVRTRGIATLLTSDDGNGIYESCTAAVVGWDGKTLLLPRPESPRVASTSEAAIRKHLDVRTDALPVHSEMPIALVNAVAGVVRVEATGRDPFPETASEVIRKVFEEETGRP